MGSVRGKRHPINFYLKLVLTISFFFVMGLFIAILHKQMHSAIGEFLLWIFLITMAFYMVYKYIKSAPTIYLNNEFLTVNYNKYFWKDLEKVEFTGKHPLLRFENDKEGMMLKFFNSKEIYVFDDMYANISAIKLFVQNQVINNPVNSVSSVQETKNRAVGYEQFTFYKNSQLFNHRGIIIWLFVIAALFGVLKANLTGVLFLLLFCSIWISGWSSGLYYFGLSDNYFMVRNHNLFWIKKAYRIDEIKEIVLEQPHYKLPNSLRVITKSYESDLFMAGSLWDTKWRKLKSDIEKANIPVRLEINIGKD